MSEALVLFFVMGFWFAMILVVALVVRALRGAPSPASVEREALRARYARGELSREEYEQAQAHMRSG